MKKKHTYIYGSSALLFFSIIFFFSCSGTPASKEKAELNNTIPVDPAITTGKLDNGLTYYIRQNKNPENRAELRLAVRAGSILEDDNQKGLAHFLEHMAFNGTKSFEKQEIVNFLESLGMRFGPELNAFTSFDETIYLLQIPTEDPEILDKGLKILYEWSHEMLIEEQEVDKERGVIIEEWRLGRGAETRIRDKQFPVLFQGSMYAERMPIGDIKVIEKANAAQLRRFYSDWYRPDLIAVLAVGDFDMVWMEEHIRKLFSGLQMPENSRPRTEIHIPEHDEIRYAIATDPEKTISEVKVFMKYPYEYEGKVREYRENMVQHLFLNMLNERLNEITKDPKAPFIDAYMGSGGIIGDKQLIVIGANVKEGKIQESLDVLITEAERAGRFGFTAGELERQKKNTMAWIEQAYHERDNAESKDLISEYIRNFLTGESIPGITYEYRMYEKYLPGISLKEVNDLTQKYITYKNTVVMVGGPEKEGSAMPDKKELARVLEEVKSKEILPYIDTEKDRPLITESLEQKKILSRTVNEEVGLIMLTLSNGIKVVLKQTDFKNDEILFTAFSPGGNSLVKEPRYIPAITAVPVIKESGLGDFTQNELEKKLAGENVEVSPWINELYEGIQGKSVPEDLETCFKLIYLYFVEPRKDPDAFLAYREQWKTEIENKSSSPDSVFWDTVWWILSQENYRRHPYTLETLKKMDIDVSYDFYLDRFGDAGDFTFFFAGDFEEKAIEPLIKTYLANLPSAGRIENWQDTGIDPPRGVMVKTVKKGLEPKSQVLIVFAGETVWSPDKTLEMNALVEILNIHLREIIREQEGGTYDIWAFGELKRFPDEEYVVYIGFGCAPEKAEKLSSMVLEEIKQFIEKGPSESELDKVREMLKREYETNIKENNYWLQALKLYYMYGLDPERILTLPSRVESLDLVTLKSAAAVYLNLSDYTRFVLLPEGE